MGHVHLGKSGASELLLLGIQRKYNGEWGGRVTCQDVCLHHLPFHLCLCTKYTTEVSNPKLNPSQLGFLSAMPISTLWLNLWVFFLWVKPSDSFSALALILWSVSSMLSFVKVLYDWNLKHAPHPYPNCLLGLFLSPHFPIVAPLYFPVIYLWFPVFYI